MQRQFYACLNCNEQIEYVPGYRIVCPCCGADYGLEGESVNEFCPKCGDPLEVSDDADRLCVQCGWWGDKSEALKNPPITGDLDTTVRQALDLYRTVVR
jgi:ribosomal protein S27AE